VVEVISPNEHAADVQERVFEFLEAGTRHVWLIYPRARRVVVFDGPRAAHIVSETEELDGGVVLPGFQLNVAALLEP
jgi:Uma2 family endonuclease